MDYHRYTDPMWTPQPANDNWAPIHVTRGLTPTCRLSVWLAGFMGYPQGWSLCGLFGLTSIVYPWASWAGRCIDALVGECDHCHNAVHRSIERAKTW